MEHFVTLFDSLFLPQGLALHRSMERQLENFTLWVVCVDRLAYDTLQKLALPNVRLIDLAVVETPDLLSVKSGRSKGEYCWTLTPFAPGFVFDADSAIERVTYLDADLWFRASPGPVFQELDTSGKAVLITDHLYAAEHDHSETNGRFCVQFMTFSRNSGEVVRKWWQDRCIEWCFARLENGLFGDQKYLDSWPTRFASEVHVLSADFPVLAPWNMTRFPYSKAFAVHFHGVRLLDQQHVLIANNYAIPEVTFRQVYIQYMEDIALALALLASIGFEPSPQAKRPSVVQGLVARLRMAFWAARVLWRAPVLKLATPQKADLFRKDQG